MNWIEDSINQYYDWLKTKTYTKEDEQSGWFAVTTPFLGLFNDPIEIYMKMEDDTILMSDDGITIKNLELAGASITRSPKRKEWLDFILLNYGVTIDNGELFVKAKQADFSQKKHNLICAISEITDMSYSRIQERAQNNCSEEIADFHKVNDEYWKEVNTYMDGYEE